MRTNKSEREIVTPGPEPTNYDRQRHAVMRLKSMRYGFFRVNRELATARICEKCNQEIEGNPVYFINKKPYHRECFNATD